MAAAKKCGQTVVAVATGFALLMGGNINIRKEYAMHKLKQAAHLAYVLGSLRIFGVGRPKKEDRALVAEQNITFRSSVRTRSLLDALVALSAADVAAMGVGGRVSMGSYLVALIEREAKAKGIEAAVPDAAPPPAPPAKPARKR
jgi:hypothetical protein